MYDILEAFSIRELESKVNEKVKEWYKPIWWLVIEKTTFYQAVFKEN